VTSASFKNRALQKKVTMSSAAITSVMKMMESLPLDVQRSGCRASSKYIDDLQDEIHGANPSNEHNKSLSLLQDVQNKKLLKGQRLHWTTTSYEVCCSSLLLGEYRRLSSNVRQSARKAYQLWAIHSTRPAL